MGQPIQADIDRASAETAFAIAEVIVPQAPERRIEAERFDLIPVFMEAATPLDQRAGIAVAKGFDRFQTQPGAARFFLERARSRGARRPEKYSAE